MNINDLFPIFASLIGFPAFVAAGVNIAKSYGLADGLASKIVAYVTLTGFIGVGVAYFTGNLPMLNQIDAQLGTLATFLVTFAAFVSELGLAKLWHAALKGTPLIGKSYSLEAKA
jgi:hypothetical protein